MTKSIINNQNENEFRTVNISNFRNLGVFATNDNKDDRAFLKINRCLEREHIGGLVLLMGLNNSGKSNVLDALEHINDPKFTKNDTPDFSYEPLKPKVELNISNGKYGDDSIIHELRMDAAFHEEGLSDFIKRVYYNEDAYEFLGHKGTFSTPIHSNYKLLPHEVSYDAYLKFLDSFFEVMTDSNIPIPNNDSLSAFRYLIMIKELISSDFCYNITHKKVILDTIESLSAGAKTSRYYYDQVGPIDSDWRNQIIDAWNKRLDMVPKDVFLRGRFETEYDYKLSNRVLRYKEKPLKHNIFKCVPQEPNDFFKLLLRITGKEPESYKHIYEYDRKGIRDSFRDEFNKELSDISDDFNNLFTADPENNYRFEVDFESMLMYFLIYRGKVELNLDRQSEGFKWMFNFYMNFLMTEDFMPGDIVLMDEFGYNLNPMSVKEIISMLRNFGKKHGVTFIIATQNFMVVDVNHLDELRLVKNEKNGISTILNNFEQFEHENHDILDPIMGALTVSRNFLKNENQKTIFVEGSSDYFFLTAMAEGLRHYNQENIDVDFIPINGLGSNKKDYAETIKQLRSIESHPVALIDADNAGEAFSKAAKDSGVSIILLNEIVGDKSVKEIEDMFTEEEREKHQIGLKSFDINACFAQNIIENYAELSDETVKRFNRIMNNLMMG